MNWRAIAPLFEGWQRWESRLAANTAFDIHQGGSKRRRPDIFGESALM
jgi:hypothetical protein